MNQPRRPDPFGEHVPPEALRARITSSLAAGGLIEPAGTRWQRTTLRVVALAALIGAAFAAGRFDGSAGSRTTPHPQFLLLLYEDSLYRDDRPVGEVVAEYGAWADSLRGEQALLNGEKLSTERVELGTTVGASSVRQHPTGLFIVHAPSLEAATILARSSPHLRYGGTVVVHRIE